MSLIVVRYQICLFFKQKTANEMRIKDWSSDVGSSDLLEVCLAQPGHLQVGGLQVGFVHSGAGQSGELKIRGAQVRSAERRVGNECVSTCRYRWSQHH